MDIMNCPIGSGRKLKEDSTFANIADLIEQISGVRNIEAISPNDTTDLVNPTIGIYVGTEGNLKIITKGGQTVTLKNLAAGVWHPIRATRIYATETTATDILGAW